MTNGTMKYQHEELIQKCQEGDRDAFVELVRTHQNMLFSILYRMLPDQNDLEDIAQEVWLKVYQSIRKLKTPAAFRSWLHRIAMNTFRDRMRQKGYQNVFSLDEALETDSGDNIKFELESPGLLPEEELLKAEWQQYLEDAIQQLPPSHRAIIIMREVQGMSYDEIGFALEISLGTVKSRIARAREKLLNTLEAYLKGTELKPHVS